MKMVKRTLQFAFFFLCATVMLSETAFAYLRSGYDFLYYTDRGRRSDCVRRGCGNFLEEDSPVFPEPKNSSDGKTAGKGRREAGSGKGGERQGRITQGQRTAKITGCGLMRQRLRPVVDDTVRIFSFLM